MESYKGRCDFMSVKRSRVSCVVAFNLINGTSKSDEFAYILEIKDSICKIDSCFNIDLAFIKNIEITLFDSCSIKKVTEVIDGKEETKEKISGTRIYINTTPLSKELITNKNGTPTGVVYECDCTGSEGALKFMNIHKGKRKKSAEPTTKAKNTKERRDDSV